MLRSGKRHEPLPYSAVDDWVLGVALNPVSDDPGILHTYAGDGPYTAEFNSCCRVNRSLNNRNNGSYRVGTQSAGAHSALWDGLDREGRPAPSGVYFCQLRAGDIIVLSALNLTR